MSLSSWAILGLIVGAIGVIITIVSYIVMLRSRSEVRKKLRAEIRRFKFKDMPLYIDGLLELKARKKVVLLQEAIRAKSEYRYEEAIAKLQSCLPLASADREKAAILNMVGTIQYNIGATLDAEKSFSEMIKITQQANLEPALAIAYGNMGLIYEVRGEFDKAMDYHKRALEINQGIENLQALAQNYGNLGNIYHNLNEFSKALEYHKKALEIDKRIGNLKGQAQDLGNIGRVYGSLGELRKALEYFERALEIDKKIGCLEGQAFHLEGIGSVYGNLSDPKKALDYFNRALDVSIKTQNLEGQANQLTNIGISYSHLGRFDKAIHYFQQARDIFIKLGAKHRVAECNKNLEIAQMAMLGVKGKK